SVRSGPRHWGQSDAAAGNTNAQIMLVMITKDRSFILYLVVWRSRLQYGRVVGAAAPERVGARSLCREQRCGFCCSVVSKVQYMAREKRSHEFRFINDVRSQGPLRSFLC